MNHNYDIGHIDLKTAFLQGEVFDNHRHVICQLPPAAGYPAHMAARLKRAAYGLNDAPRLWWNRLDKSLRSYGLVPTRADRCCYVLYSSAGAAKSYYAPDPAVWEATTTATGASEANIEANEANAIAKRTSQRRENTITNSNISNTNNNIRIFGRLYVMTRRRRTLYSTVA